MARRTGRGASTLGLRDWMCVCVCVCVDTILDLTTAIQVHSDIVRVSCNSSGLKKYQKSDGGKHDESDELSSIYPRQEALQ